MDSMQYKLSLQIRKDKAEKKLLDSTRDSELVREKLQRKLDDAMAMLKRKEKEFDETLNHFQADIDNLESEKGDLKNKLKDITKKTLIQGGDSTDIYDLGVLLGTGLETNLGVASLPSDNVVQVTF